MDGKSIKITRKVSELSEKYDILFVISAGNDGARPWRVVGAPADAEAVLTVGATKYKIWDDMKYSSQGPEWLDYVKPEVSCFSTIGTSFSAPTIAGLAACLLENDPKLSSEDLKSLIIQSCNLYNRPNNYIGYGVPDAQFLFDQKKNSIEEIKVSGNSYRIEFQDDVPVYVPVYHKVGFRVLEKEVIKPKNNKIKIQRPKDAETSTLLLQTKGLEIVWE
jgi:subtilisin family serine protease